MTEFIDLLYCSGLNGLSDLNGSQILAYAPMSEFIEKGDIVRIDALNGFYLVTCKTCVSKDSDTYEFITEALGTLYKVTDKYSHQEVEDSENE